MADWLSKLEKLSFVSEEWEEVFERIFLTWNSPLRIFIMEYDITKSCWGEVRVRCLHRLWRSMVVGSVPDPKLLIKDPQIEKQEFRIRIWILLETRDGEKSCQSLLM